jgi:hypothetical protein
LLKFLLDSRAAGRYIERVIVGVDNPKLLFAAALFAEIEKNQGVEFFSMKNNAEIWIHSARLKEHPLSKTIEVSPKWPDADVNSESIWAAYIKFTENAVVLSFELGSPAPQSTFDCWKLQRGILANSPLFSGSSTKCKKLYSISPSMDFADFAVIASAVVRDFIEVSGGIADALEKCALSSR